MEPAVCRTVWGLGPSPLVLWVLVCALRKLTTS